MANSAKLIVSTLVASGVVVFALATILDLKLTSAQGVNGGPSAAGPSDPRSDVDALPAHADGPARVAVQPPDTVGDFDGAGASALTAAADEPTSAKVDERDSRTLDEKYAGATLGQLMAAKCLLEERQTVERDVIARELMAAGKLTEVPQNPDGGHVVMKGSSDGSPVSTVSAWKLVDGVNVVSAAVINGEEYPDYRALELEVWWLEGKIRKLKKSSTSDDVFVR